MNNLRYAATKEQRVAVITGGSRGIGRACALRIAEEGRNVVIVDLLSEQAKRVVKEIQKLGQKGFFVETDVTKESEVWTCIQKTAELFGRLDILVCCAGTLGLEAPFLEQSATQFDKVIRTNLYGVYYAHQAAIPHMLEKGWGRCVTITSGARHGSTNKVPYSVSKGAVYSFIGALGNAFPKQDVFVNGVEPGRVLTDMVVPRFSADFIENPGNPMGRYADPEEVAEVVEFLCSERNTYTTGSVWSTKGATDPRDHTTG